VAEKGGKKMTMTLPMFNLGFPSHHNSPLLPLHRYSSTLMILFPSFSTTNKTTARVWASSVSALHLRY